MDDTTDLFAALDHVSTPLAVLGPGGKTVRINEDLQRRFGPVEVEPIDPADLKGDHAHSTQVTLRCGPDRISVEANALTLPLDGHHLLIVNEAACPPLASEVERLRDYVDRLEQEVATDHLTGAWNRAQFDRLIAAEFARSEDLLLPLALILFDIDHFKRVNDVHGHAAGDDVLREAVRVTSAAIRRTDRLFRWGGEEFAVLLVDCGYRGAERVAEKLRQSFAAHDFPHVGRVTISAGVAERCPDESAAIWFGRLDSSLYAAKTAGRNRVVVARDGLSDVVFASKRSRALHLQWHEAYECGDPVIDDQHRELFSLSNGVLVSACMDRASFLQQLDGLLLHVRQHFADEEEILERLGYPHLSAHKRAHRKLLGRASRLHQSALHGRARLGDLVEYFAQHVVADHLLKFDRDFIPFLQPPKNT